MLKHVTIFAISILCVCWHTAAQTYIDGPEESTDVVFRVNSFVLDTSLANNGRNLRRFVSDINALLSQPGNNISGLVIESSASPEGDPDRNVVLGNERARAVRDYLADNLPLRPSQISIRAVGANWDGFVKAVRNSSSPWKDDILGIVATYGIKTGVDRESDLMCQRKLKELDHGKAWAWLLKEIFPPLRQGTGRIRCVYDAPQVPATQPASAKDTVVIVKEYYFYDTLTVFQNVGPTEFDIEGAKQEIMESLGRKPVRYRKDSLWREPVMAFRSNLLLPLMNIGVEVPFSNRVSMSADLNSPWVWRPWMNGITKTGNQHCVEDMSFEGGLRLWLGVNHENKDEYRKYRLRGHSVGLNVSGGYYDLQYNWEGIQGEYISTGISYMYALPLGKGGVHLEFEIGAGWLWTAWRGYDVHEKNGPLIGNYKDESWNGPVPVRTAVSFVVPVFRKQ